MGFELLTQEDCQTIMDKLNNRPRKVIGFRTPAEVFFSMNLQLRLTTPLPMSIHLPQEIRQEL